MLNVDKNVYQNIVWLENVSPGVFYTTFNTTIVLVLQNCLHLSFFFHWP